MSRQSAPRNLTLTEELEKLEQSITLTLQEIDSNFSKAHRIVTTSILPVVEQYAKHSSDVWEGSKFWKQFFEASANVSLSGYEEAAVEEDATHTETTTTDLDTPTDHDEYQQSGTQLHDDDDDEEFTVDSPTQVTGVQTTPKIGSAKKVNRKAQLSRPEDAYRSPSPRKYTGTNPKAMQRSPDEPSTPRPQMGAAMQSSPFEPESAYQPSTQQPRTNNDPLMHRVLDRNYRIQATPHTQRRQKQQGAAAAPKATPATAIKRVPWDDSPQSSPAIAAPQLRSDLFSPAKRTGAPRTPGISVLTPARKTGHAAPTTSTGRQLFSPQDKAYTTSKDRTTHIFDDSSDDEDDGFGDMSPPKTMQFHVPQSRLMQTPAREASKRIVDDLLLTAGADATDDIEGLDDPDIADEPSPSVIRRAWDDDTF
ncbi:DASH complex subunit ask1 [Vermiconidia calcicola]|uniref:DASH complex subunit ask1 n=1 Tax=Vermiconidia calcicola TaxID=1690605 RepID=A0ACC3MU70_9PEZI|nr:DASH complex subunit ask1 [Vermiconidia calcicola]